MKSKAKTRKQQEFFKKQRLEKTLQKVAPNCPNLGASIDRTDLLKMDIIYKKMRVELVQPARNSRNSQCLRTRSIHCLLLQRYRPESPMDAHRAPPKADEQGEV
ncbi:uncharacterized protein ISCGN_000766 [Ixodes scapularis]